MKLTIEQVKSIANLARLAVSDREAEQYRQELSAILDYIDQLQTVDTAGVEPTSQVTDLTNIMRGDEVEPSGIDQQLIATAPNHDEGYIVIPKVFKD